jgi:hypothetical protein
MIFHQYFICAYQTESIHTLPDKQKIPMDSVRI